MLVFITDIDSVLMRVLKWLKDSLLELLVVFDPVANDTDHFAQLGHHLLLLFSLDFQSQWSEGWEVF